jgi:hypothetical protein
MNIVKVISTELTDLSQRLVKFLRLGKSDVRTAIEVGPFGVDSNAPKGTVAAYSDTAVKGQSVIIGYVNTRQEAGVGEYRTYAVDSSGNVAFYTWIKANGTMEIGGDTDNMVRYSELETAFNELRDDFNAHLANWNAFALAYVPGSPSTLGTPPTAIDSQTSTADITPARIDEIKTL